jgi:hypothetical protein
VEVGAAREVGEAGRFVLTTAVTVTMSPVVGCGRGTMDVGRGAEVELETEEVVVLVEEVEAEVVEGVDDGEDDEEAD